MSAIVPPKGCSAPIEQTIKVGKKSLKLSIYENPDTITIFIGGHTLFCIDALINKPGSMMDRIGYDISVAHLSHIYYNINCSLEKNFQRGHDTNMILTLLLSYIKDNYKYIKSVSFNDSSSRECDNGNVVELSEMSYIRTGFTWYETHFSAYLAASDAHKFKKCEENFQKLKSEFKWENMKNYMSEQLPLDESIMHDIFENAKTWQDFFGPVSDRIGISEFCVFVAPWLHRFLTTTLRYNFSSGTYLFPIEKIPYIEYIIEIYTRGGRRYTRKSIKNFSRVIHNE